MRVGAILAEAGCARAVHARAIGGDIDPADGGFSYRADQPVVPASVMKVQVALAVESMIAGGSVDPTERLRLGDAERTPGPVWLSLFRDGAELLIWTDRAAPPIACAQIRTAMSWQLTRHRLAAAAPSDVTVAAKSGGLMGVVRNEIGVLTYPDGAAYDPSPRRGGT